MIYKGYEDGKIPHWVVYRDEDHSVGFIEWNNKKKKCYFQSNGSGVGWREMVDISQYMLDLEWNRQ